MSWEHKFTTLNRANDSLITTAVAKPNLSQVRFLTICTSTCWSISQKFETMMASTWITVRRQNIYWEGQRYLRVFNVIFFKSCMISNNNLKGHQKISSKHARLPLGDITLRIRRYKYWDLLSDWSLKWLWQHEIIMMITIIEK